MSKKSRRRNRRLLTALAALGGAAMLANRRRNQANVEMDLPKSNIGSFADARSKMTTNKAYRNNMPKGIDKKISDVYPDAIMRGGKGVKQGFKTTSANVQKGLIDPPGLFNQGVVKFDKPVSIIPKKKFKGSAQIMRERATAKADAKRNDMLRAIRGDVPVQAADPIMDFDRSQDFGFGAMAKDGGKIVKTETGGKAVRPKKIKRIQIKGFGKARK